MRRAKTYIKNNPTHVAAGSCVLGVVSLLAVSVPAITAQAENARADVVAPKIDVSAESTQIITSATGLTETLASEFLKNTSSSAIAGASLIETSQNAMAEHKCLSEAVYYEARSEGKDGQKAVAEVVQNRVRSKHYPNSICGVIYQGSERSTGCQFSFTCDGSLKQRPRGKTWLRANRIATLAMTGGITPLTDRATHYHNLNVRPAWSGSLVMTKQIETHKFYRTRWRERGVSNAGLSVAPPSP